MACKEAINYEEDMYFLGLIANHPNLYHQKHEFYEDPIMRKGSWGQIALSMCMTGQEVERKWQKMCESYQEESALRDLESFNDIQVDADEKSSHHLLYNRLRQMLHVSTEATRSRCEDISRQQRPAVNNFTKKRLAKSTLRAKETSHQLRQHLMKAVEHHGTSANDKIGKLLAAEMLLKSPKTRALITRKIFQCVTHQDEVVTDNESEG